MGDEQSDCILDLFLLESEAERESAKAVLVTGEQAFVVRTP